MEFSRLVKTSTDTGETADGSRSSLSGQTEMKSLGRVTETASWKAARVTLRVTHMPFRNLRKIMAWTAVWVAVGGISLFIRFAVPKQSEVGSSKVLTSLLSLNAGDPMTTSTVERPSCNYSKYDMCSHYHKPKGAVVLQTFIRIGALSPRGQARVLAFSAFFDERNRTVKVVTDADVLCYNSLDIVCLLWYSSQEKPYISHLMLGYITTTQPGETPRVGVIYYCETPDGVPEIPELVSFNDVSEGCISNTSNTAMTVQYSMNYRHQFTVCVAPLFGNISAENLLEFVEMHRILGAEKFFFYNESIPKNCESLLSTYIRKQIVEIVQWKSLYPADVLYHNQQIMQADCMYRNMRSARYVAQVDVDEVLMPRQYQSWIAMVEADAENDTAAYMFLNRFYDTASKTACYGGSIASGFNSTTLSHLRYHTTYFGPTDRSKLIYRPERIDQICTHHALPLAAYKTVVLNHTEGILHHYRKPVMTRFRTSQTSVDYHMCQFGKMLLRKMKQTFYTTFQPSAAGIT